MHSRVWGALIASSLGWGFAAVGVRFAFEEGVSTFTVIDVRLAVAAGAVVLFAVVTRRGASGEAWRRGAVIGVLRIGLAPVLFIASLQHISAGVEGLFITLIPVVTAVLAWRFLREHLTGLQVLGLLAGLAGAAILILGGESGLGGGEGDPLIGGLLAMGGVFAGASSGVIQRKFAPHHDTAELALPMFLVGAAIAITISLLVEAPGFETLDATLWLVLIALGLFSTLLPFVGTLYASRFVSAARVSIVGYLAPAISVTAGIVILDEVVSGGIVIGGLLAVSGAVLVSLAPQSAPPPVRIRG